MSETHLAWLNKRYKFKPPETSFGGNDGTFESLESDGRAFVAEDLRRLVSNLALNTNRHPSLVGFGVTKVDEKSYFSICVSVYDAVTARMLGL